MLPLGICVLVLLVAVVVLVVGLRGRFVGDDPHCRSCGFNLRGRDPGSTRCPECGTVLSERTMRVGVRVARRPLVWAGGLLLLVSLGGVGVFGWAVASHFDLIRWRPTNWLLADLERGPGSLYLPSLNELTRRVRDKQSSAATVDQIVDRALKHQADRTGVWDANWLHLIVSAGIANRLTKDRADQYLKNSIGASLTARSKVRRGGEIIFEEAREVDRLDTFARITGRVEESDLTLDGVVIAPKPIPTDTLWIGGDRSTSHVTANAQHLKNLSDGPHTLSLTYTHTIQQFSPFSAGPVTVKTTVTAPIEIFPSGATVDDFKIDPALADAERAAISEARVIHDPHGNFQVRVKTDRPAVALSMAVSIRQGKTELPAFSGLLVEKGSAARWSTVAGFPKSAMTGAVDVVLHPDQAPADRQPTLGTYWGADIVISNVVIDAPYQAPFNHDQALRPAVERSLAVISMRRDPGAHQLIGNIRFRSPPVKLAYQVFVSVGGHEIPASSGPCMIWPAGKVYGWTVRWPDFDSQASECDLVFRPCPDWEKESEDAAAPWAGEIVLHHVKIETPASAATRR